MSDGLDGCSHIIDTSGLHGIANLNGNSKSAFKSALKSGVIAVPAVVWKEFRELYEDEADELESYIHTKLSMKNAYYIGEASIADSTNSTLLHSPYDAHADLCAAAMCQIEKRILLTADGQKSYYRKLKCCEVQDLTGWLATEDN